MTSPTTGHADELRPPADIKADIEYLTERWEMVQKRVETVGEAPAPIYEEPALHLRLLRDLVTHETKQGVVDNDTAYGEMQDFVKRFMASILTSKGDLNLPP